MEEIKSIRISELKDFKNHPFHVQQDMELCALMKSIEDEGVLVPLLIRPNPDGEGYEVIGMNTVDVALICKALGDSNRLQIVQMLSEGEKCGCKLLEAFEITQPTLSHHMRILTECGLVIARKEGKWSHYSLNCETLKEYKQFIEGLSCTDGQGGCCNS